jgi:hypothetical protein
MITDAPNPMIVKPVIREVSLCGAGHEFTPFISPHTPQSGYVAANKTCNQMILLGSHGFKNSGSHYAGKRFNP